MSGDPTNSKGGTGDVRNPWARFAGEPLIAPSLLACDFMRMGEQIAAVTAAGARVLHADVMDGHFVPNLAISPGVVRSVRARTDLLLDVHLMVTNPFGFIESFVEAGADSITFHIESDDDPGEVIDRLRELGIGVGVVLKPGTDVSLIAEVVPQVDLVLVMTVEPGFGGQSFMTDQLDKIRAVRGIAGGGIRVEVDGGVNGETIGLCAKAGADTFVAGVGVFRAPDIAVAFKALGETAAAAR